MMDYKLSIKRNELETAVQMNLIIVILNKIQKYVLHNFILVTFQKMRMILYESRQNSGAKGGV